VTPAETEAPLTADRVPELHPTGPQVCAAAARQHGLSALGRAVLVVLDLVLVTAVFPVSFYLRSAAELAGPRIWMYRHVYPLLAVLHVLVLALAGVYRHRFRSYWQLFSRISGGELLAFGLSASFLYVFRLRWGTFPTGGLAIAFGLVVLGLFGLHGCVLARAGAVRRRVVVVGSDVQADLFTRRDRTEIIRLDRLEQFTDHRDIDEVVLCERLHDENTLNLLLHLLRQLKTDIYFAPDLYARLLTEAFNGNGRWRFLATFIGQKTDLQEGLMRALDVAGSLAALLITAPIWPLIALAVRLSGSGPVFYVQQRAGKDGRVFRLYKFRTMRSHGTHDDLAPARPGDPRITRVGRFLRRTHLDELPQLINVLRGEMSLVGPRPENLERIAQHRVLQGIRLAVRPGITGLAQIRSLYDLHPHHKIRYDYLYIQRRSVQLNLYILWRTIPVVLACRGQ